MYCCMYNMCVIVLKRVSVSNFKVETSENLENAFYVFYVTLQKTQKVAFFNFEKKT